MNTVIWYFTGTGNSLSAARRAAKALGGDFELHSMAFARGRTVEIAASRVGFVFPVYSFGLPRIVKEFVEHISNIQAERVFAIATCGGGPGGTLAQLKKALEAKGARLDAATAVTYPGNCIPLYPAPRPDRCETIIASGEHEIDAFMADVIADRLRQPGILSSIGAALVKPLYAGFLSSVRRSDRFFRAEASCTSCGLCMRVCPVGNISAASDGRPVWGNCCEGCLACLNLCPVEAIQYGWLTRGRRRYRHPGITSEELAGQRTDRP
ncbi:MAG TPA: EFR1 family ferrodoxin [Candidatus Ozemobacteraceae bacterium]|nr:EFR1 family ferrodoxin [Candidatus Ozemobacteraceae bacterium]